MKAVSKVYLLKQKIISLSIILIVVLTAAGFSLMLGKYFLNSIVKSYPVGRTVYKKVYYQVEVKKVRLNPVSIYTLQAGVFLDIAGAKAFADSLLDKGLRPYISPSSPYKVLIFTAASREDLEKYRAHSPEDVFIITEILNSSEVELPANKEVWVDFLTQFTELFSDTLNVLNKSDNVKENALAEQWRKLAIFLQNQSAQDKKNVEVINALMDDCEGMAKVLDTPRSTIQEQGSNAQVILKAKYDFDTLRQILFKFE